MKRAIQQAGFLLLFSLFTVAVKAQVFPVQVTPQLLPPNSLQVSEYYGNDTTNAKLNLLLLLRDINRATIRVRLRMTIESQTVRIKSREDVNYDPFAFDLQTGVPRYILPVELAQYFNANNLEFSGITQQDYVNTGKLPEGFYTFCFEAVDMQTGQTVSNRGCSFAWMALSEPPFLVLPQKAESVAPNTPQSLLFQWTPRQGANPNAYNNVEYKLTIVDITQQTGMSPEAAFFTGAVLLDSVVQSTTKVLGVAEPQLEPGHKYAWRVQVKTRAGGQPVQFRNDGYSEIFWFNYQNTCPVPQAINDSVQGYRAIIDWQANPEHLEYKVIYREKNNPIAEWFPLLTTDPQVAIGDLKPNTEYEYRVGGACIVDNFTFSATYTFTTKDSTFTTIPDCGYLPDTLVNTGVPLLENLVPGDTIYAGDFKVVATAPVQKLQTGRFTGQGYVPVSYLANMKLAVVFNDITVSATKKLLIGKIETTYDPTEGGIVDVDEYLDYFIGGYGVGAVVSGLPDADTSFGFVINWPGGIAVSPLPPVPGPYTISVTPAGGGTPVTYTVTELPTTMMDAGGNIYQVNANGTPVLIGKAGGKELLEKMNKKLIDDNKALVKFVEYDDPKVKYAFDAWREEYKMSNTFNKEYERIKTASNNSYYVSAKAIAPAETDYLKVEITKTDASIVPDSIQFISGKGTIYTKTFLDSTNGKYHYEIAVVGGPEKDAQEIYAAYRQSGAKTLNLGKVLVASYPFREFTVKLVPVNGASLSATEINDFEIDLNEIYNKLNVRVIVDPQDNFQNSQWDLNNDGKLEITGSGLFTTLTDEMKALNKAYLPSGGLGNTVYLFILTSANLPNAEGDMPRGKQFGYLFTSSSVSLGRTAAHEIGHGLFKLKHLIDGHGFSSTIPSFNLMAPGNTGKLAKAQWDLIHDPANLLTPFDRDEDAMSLVVSDLTELKNTFKNSKNGISFLNPGGKRVTIPVSELKEISISTGEQWYSEEGNGEPVNFFSALGVLNSFKIERPDGSILSYKGIGTITSSGERKFDGYKLNGDGPYYFDMLSHLLKSTPSSNNNNLPEYYDHKVLVGFPCANTGNFYLKIKPISYRSEKDIDQVLPPLGPINTQQSNLINVYSDLNLLPIDLSFIFQPITPSSGTSGNSGVEKSITITASSGFKNQVAKDYVNENCDCTNDNLYKTIQAWKYADLIDKYPVVCENCILLKDLLIGLSTVQPGATSVCEENSTFNEVQFFPLKEEVVFTTATTVSELNEQFIRKSSELKVLNEAFVNFSAYYSQSKTNGKLNELLANIANFECLNQEIAISDRLSLIEDVINNGESINSVIGIRILSNLLISTSSNTEQVQILNKLSANNHLLLKTFFENYPNPNDALPFVSAVAALAKGNLPMPQPEPYPTLTELQSSPVIARSVFPFIPGQALTLEVVYNTILDECYATSLVSVMDNNIGARRFNLRSTDPKGLLDYITLYPLEDIKDCNNQVIWAARTPRVVTFIEALQLSSIFAGNYRHARAVDFLMKMLRVGTLPLQIMTLYSPPLLGQGGAILNVIFIAGTTINIVNTLFEPLFPLIEATNDQDLISILSSWHTIVKYSNLLMLGTVGGSLAWSGVKSFVKFGARVFESTPAALENFYAKLQQLYSTSASRVYNLLRINYFRLKLLLQKKLFPKKLFEVDPSFKSADEAAGVLVNGEYLKNPTAVNVIDLKINPSGVVKLDESAGSALNGKYMYVVDEYDNFVIGTRANGIPPFNGKAPHPTLIGGANPKVQVAGIIEFRGGKIYQVDNISGHFKPDTESLKQAERIVKEVFSTKNFANDFQGFIPFN